MLQDIAIEEFGIWKWWAIDSAAHQQVDQTAVYDAPLFKLKGGGPHFLDSQAVG